MAWKNSGLNNTTARASVLGKISDKLFEVGKLFSGVFTASSPPASDDVGLIRLNATNDGLERWTGTAWENIVWSSTYGGTDNSTLTAFKTALNLDSSTGAGSVIGKKVLSKSLTLKTTFSGNSQIVQTNYTSFKARIPTADYIASQVEATGSYYEGATAFRVINGTSEKAAGFISNISKTTGSGYFEVTFTCTTLFGKDVSTYSGNPVFGAADDSVTLELYRRYVIGENVLDIKQQITTEVTDLADDDRFAVSDESISGDPTYFVKFSTLVKDLVGGVSGLEYNSGSPQIKRPTTSGLVLGSDGLKVDVGPHLELISSGTNAGKVGVITGTSSGDLITLGTGGLVDPARLGSGTASSTKILYGDGSWGAPPVPFSNVTIVGSGSDGYRNTTVLYIQLSLTGLAVGDYISTFASYSLVYSGSPNFRVVEGTASIVHSKSTTNVEYRLFKLLTRTSETISPQLQIYPRDSNNDPAYLRNPRLVAIWYRPN